MPRKQLFKVNAARAIALAIATSFAATTAMPVDVAEAGHKKHWKKHHKVHKAHRKHHRRDRHNGGDALAAGVIGFALGAIIADQASRNRQPEVVYQPTYVAPEPVYVAPQPAYEPRVVTYDDYRYSATYEPWTPEWRAWCSDRYRSFNPSTGTFRGYDGLDHFCVVK